MPEQEEGKAPPPQSHAKVRDPRNDGLATIGYVLAVLAPLFGVGIAIALNNRNDPRGANVMLTALAVITVYVLVILIVIATTP